MPGVTWNLHCEHCGHSWMQKIFDAQVICPVCSKTFDVGFREVSLDERVAEHLQEMADQRREISEPVDTHD